MTLALTHLIGFASGASTGVGNDAFTVSLLHCDGVDTSTTFSDSAAGGTHTWTAFGNAQVDTAEAKFGGSALFDGSGDYVSTPDSVDWTFGSGDWTVDLWFNRSGGDGTFRRLLANTNATGTDWTIRISLSDTNVVQATGNGLLWLVAGTTTITTTGWHHVAVVRTGNTIKLFVDGVQEGGDQATSGAASDSAGAMTVGRNGDVNTGFWTGWLDEIRISKGVARWTANFTPPIAPYG